MSINNLTETEVNEIKTVAKEYIANNPGVDVEKFYNTFALILCSGIQVKDNVVIEKVWWSCPICRQKLLIINKRKNISGVYTKCKKCKQEVEVINIVHN